MSNHERLTRWMLGHAQPTPYCLDLDHPVQKDIAYAADRIYRLEQDMLNIGDLREEPNPAAQLAAMRKRTPKVCPGCGETFAGLKQQKVCGDRCRKRMLRREK